MAGKRNITLKKGDTFNLQFTISTDSTAWDLTNYSIQMTVRPFVGSTTVILDASTTNGLITKDALNGRTIITVPALTTAGFPVGRHDYDIVFTAASVVTTVLEGKFIVTQGATV